MPQTPRRVLLLTDVLGGGTGNHIYAMMRHWDRSQWRAAILSQAPRFDGLLSPDAAVEVLPQPGRAGVYPFAQLGRLRSIARSVRAEPPDLVHAYFFWSILYARILKRLGSIRRLVENREDEGFAWGRHEYTLLRLTRSLPDRVICVSEAVRRAALAREGLDPERTVVIHNGVEPPGTPDRERAAVRRELGFEDGDRVVGMVANWNRPVKGVPYFLDAMPAIRKAVPSARFLIVGEGSDDDTLRRRARELGIEPFLVLAGYRRDVDAYYASMDVSVLTSLSEGLSITLLESMNRGLPVVVTGVGGNPEVVREGETGFLVPPRDVPAFVERVVRLLRDDALRARMGRAACARIEAHFKLRDVAARYLDLYAQALR